MSKSGPNVGGANIDAIEDFDVPVGNIDYCCSDTTASNGDTTGQTVLTTRDGTPLKVSLARALRREKMRS